MVQLFKAHLASDAKAARHIGCNLDLAPHRLPSILSAHGLGKAPGARREHVTEFKFITASIPRDEFRNEFITQLRPMTVKLRSF